MEFREETILVSVQKVLKGTPREAAYVEVLQARPETFEHPRVMYEEGDHVLVFANVSGNRYEPFASTQGVFSLQPGSTDTHEMAIEKILDYDAATTPERRTAILRDMLDMDNPLTRDAGLGIIYLERHVVEFHTAPLIQPALKLAQSADGFVGALATQVLGRIADTSVIPSLIDLFGSPNRHIADTAAQVFKTLTGTEIVLDHSQPLEARLKVIQKWQEWWEQNKDQVVLIK